MTWPANGGWHADPWIGIKPRCGCQSQLGTAGTPDTFKVALFNNSVLSTGSNPYSVALASAVYLVGDWATGNEVAMAGAPWPAGGVNLTTPTTSESPAGTIKWTVDPVSVASTTLATSIYGCLIYDSTLATKYGVCAIPFSGAPYGTTAGTFGITWAAGGVFAIDITP